MASYTEIHDYVLISKLRPKLSRLNSYGCCHETVNLPPYKYLAWSYVSHLLKSDIKQEICADNYSIIEISGFHSNGDSYCGLSAYGEIQSGKWFSVSEEHSQDGTHSNHKDGGTGNHLPNYTMS
jgi:hypothetical protein